ncbi:MAG: hypothetical protein LBR21_00730, partial [Propionibacteriaceae bacterium]|nr:hypothetical protein [Propionibacteriaceae bacterium]
ADSLDRESSEALEALIRAVRAEPGLAEPLALTGLAAWVAGDGVLQLICAEKLTEMGSAAAGLLYEIGDLAVPPSQWEELKETLVEELVSLLHSDDRLEAA